MTSVIPATMRQRWLRMSNIPIRFHNRAFSDIEPSKNTQWINAWVDAVLRGEIVVAKDSAQCGKGLLLQGQPGRGKTTLACLAALRVLREMEPEVLGYAVDAPRQPVYYTTYPELLRTQQRAYDGDEKATTMISRVFGDDYRQPVALLVLDDIGKEHTTSSGWAENIFDHLFRRRFDLGLPTVITTNVPVSRWASTYSPAMESFAHEAAVIVEILSEGGDRRK